jgi:hypothetical protein
MRGEAPVGQADGHWTVSSQRKTASVTPSSDTQGYCRRRFQPTYRAIATQITVIAGNPPAMRYPFTGFLPCGIFGLAVGRRNVETVCRLVQNLAIRTVDSAIGRRSW